MVKGVSSGVVRFTHLGIHNFLSVELPKFFCFDHSGRRIRFGKVYPENNCKGKKTKQIKEYIYLNQTAFGA